MKTIEQIKEGIRHLFETDPNIHVSISMSHPKRSVKDASVMILDVYPHIFRIRETACDSPKCYSVQYTEVLTGQVEIRELET